MENIKNWNANASVYRGPVKILIQKPEGSAVS